MARSGHTPWDRVAMVGRMAPSIRIWPRMFPITATIQQCKAGAIDVWAEGNLAEIRKLKGRDDTYRLRVGF